MDKYMNANIVFSKFSRDYMGLKKDLPIRPSEMGVLNIITLRDGNFTPLTLAEMLGVSKPMIAAHIHSLEKKGYIYKEASLDDKRSFYVRPTEKARALADEFEARQTEYSRKSIRNFNGESITDAELKEILKAAYASPVGRAMYDTLSLTVISNKEVLANWEKHMATVTGNPDLHPFYGAPTVILVSSAGEPAGNINYSNAAIVVHNMALAATELGVGACHIWGATGVLGGNAELVKELKVPKGMVPCCAIALGHFDGKYELREIPENRIKTEYVKQ